MRIARTIGALLLLLGGALDVARLVIANEGVLLGFRSLQLALNVIPGLIIGVGLLLLGLSLVGRSRVAVIVAGVVGILVFVLSVIEIAASSSFGSTIAQLADYLSFLAVIVAAIILLADRTKRGPTRWGLSIPAICIVLFVITLFTVPLLWFDLLPGVGFVIAGLLLARSRGTGQTPAIS